MKRTVKENKTYTYPHKRDRNRLTTNLMLRAIRNALRNKDNSQEEADEGGEINKPQKWKKWTDPLVIVTVALAFATFALYIEATNQSGISKLTAQAAIRQDSVMIVAFHADSVARVRADSTDSVKFQKQYYLAKKAFDSSTTANNASIAVSQQTLQAQINSLDSVQKNFQTQNEPYLQIDGPTFDSLGTSKKLNLPFEIQNLGSYPAKIVATKFNIKGSTEDVPNFGYNPADDTLYLINKYAIKEKPIKTGLRIDSIFSNPNNDSLLKTGRLEFYFWGFIQYNNLVTNQLRIYIFKIIVHAKPGERGRFILNENRNIPAEDTAKIFRLGTWDEPLVTIRRN